LGCDIAPRVSGCQAINDFELKSNQTQRSADIPLRIQILLRRHGYVHDAVAVLAEEPGPRAVEKDEVFIDEKAGGQPALRLRNESVFS
jgi:hypothetical protein